MAEKKLVMTFATSKGDAYSAPLAASYVEEVESVLFDDEV